MIKKAFGSLCLIAVALASLATACLAIRSDIVGRTDVGTATESEPESARAALPAPHLEIQHDDARRHLTFGVPYEAHIRQADRGAYGRDLGRTFLMDLKEGDAVVVEVDSDLPNLILTANSPEESEIGRMASFPSGKVHDRLIVDASSSGAYRIDVWASHSGADPAPDGKYVVRASRASRELLLEATGKELFEHDRSLLTHVSERHRDRFPEVGLKLRHRHKSMHREMPIRLKANELIYMKGTHVGTRMSTQSYHRVNNNGSWFFRLG